MAEETLTKVIVDCESGTTKIVPLTLEELADLQAQREAFEAEQAARAAEEQAKADAKTSAIAKLAKLGLSDAEIAALVG
jgi:hypothetical protein